MDRLMAISVRLFLICLFSTFLLGQTKTVIDTRGVQPSEPDCCHFVSFAGFGPQANETLKATFTIGDPASLKAASPIDYEMVITNAGKESIVVPRSLDWKDIDNGSPELHFLRAALLFQLSSENPPDIWMSRSGVTLYSSADQPSTQLVLAPGDSLHILGSTVLADPQMVGKKSGKVTLTGQFCLMSMDWSRGPEPGSGGKSERCASVDQKYELNLDKMQ